MCARCPGCFVSTGMCVRQLVKVRVELRGEQRVEHSIANVQNHG